MCICKIVCVRTCMHCVDCYLDFQSKQLQDIALDVPGTAFGLSVETGTGFFRSCPPCKAQPIEHAQGP